jgi:hypothetical protein
MTAYYSWTAILYAHTVQWQHISEYCPWTAIYIHISLMYTCVSLMGSHIRIMLRQLLYVCILLMDSYSVYAFSSWTSISVYCLWTTISALLLLDSYIRILIRGSYSTSVYYSWAAISPCNSWAPSIYLYYSWAAMLTCYSRMAQRKV